MGEVWQKKGDLDAAIEEYETATRINPNYFEAQRDLGLAIYERASSGLSGDPNRCLVEMNIASKISPTYSEGKKYPAIDIAALKTMMAKCYEIKGDYKRAASFWSDVAAMTKDNKSLLKHISKLEKQKPEHNNKKIDCQDSTVQAMLIKGITESDSKEYEVAKSTFENMTINYPHCFEGWQNHGALEEAASNLQAAMADYKQAITLAPNYDGLYYNMGYLLEKMGLAAEAGNMYEQFHALSGKYPYDPRHIVGLEQEYARQQARLHGK